MRRLSILIVALVLAAGLLSGCGTENIAPIYWGMTPDNTPVRYRQVELAAGEGLEKLVPAALVREMGDDARLPPLAAGDRRYATVLMGCRQSSAPRFTVEHGKVSIGFPEDGPPKECYAPEYYVAVCDVPR